MKKVIFGTGLLICGTLGVLATVLTESIHLASSNHISSDGNPELQIAGILFLIGGFVLNILGFIEKDKKE